MQTETRDLLIAWSLLPFLNPARTRLLLQSFAPVSLACQAPLTLLQGLLSVTPEQADRVKRPLQQAEARRRIDRLRPTVIVLGDAEYPALLREIPDPPLALHTRGDRALLLSAAVAVVGSRRASPYGVNAARELTARLAAAGLTIVAGLARGIDATAHRAALDGEAGTIAVLGTGIDIVYPREHASLLHRIGDRGLILSEFPPGTPPLAGNFPMRNRVISGLCMGTIVVEATGRSGSLITARMAAEQGREVFAVPGSIFSAASEGTHRLIQSGAKLVHDVVDVLEELPGEWRAQTVMPAQPHPSLSDVFEALSREESIHIDSLATRLGRSTEALAGTLLQLELGGWIHAVPGSRYVRSR